MKRHCFYPLIAGAHIYRTDATGAEGGIGSAVAVQAHYRKVFPIGAERLCGYDEFAITLADHRTDWSCTISERNRGYAAGAKGAVHCTGTVVADNADSTTCAGLCATNHHNLAIWLEQHVRRPIFRSGGIRQVPHKAAAAKAAINGAVGVIAHKDKRFGGGGVAIVAIGSNYYFAVGLQGNRHRRFNVIAANSNRAAITKCGVECAVIIVPGKRNPCPLWNCPNGHNLPISL